MTAISGDTPSVSSPSIHAFFDFTGILIQAGPVYYSQEKSTYWQWVFLADSSACAEMIKSEMDAKSGSNEEKKEEEQPWLLAIRLHGMQEAVSWIRPGSKESGGTHSVPGTNVQYCNEEGNEAMDDDVRAADAVHNSNNKTSSAVVVSFKNIELIDADVNEKVWRAEGGMHTAVKKHMSCSMVSKNSGEIEKALFEWAIENRDIIKGLKSRVDNLMK